MWPFLSEWGETLILWDPGPTLVTPFNLNYFLTGPISKEPHRGLGLQPMYSGETQTFSPQQQASLEGFPSAPNAHRITIILIRGVIFVPPSSNSARHVAWSNSAVISSKLSHREGGAEPQCR